MFFSKGAIFVQKHGSLPLAGALGGALAAVANWPLPWLLGSLVAAITLRCVSNRDYPALPGGRKTGQWLIGSGIGLHFSADVLAQVINQWGLIVLGACCTLLLSLIGISLLYRAGIARSTAFFASLPGGSAEMVVLGLKHGADPAQIAAAHSLRVVLIVLVIPPLSRYFLPQITPSSLPVADSGQLVLLLCSGALLAQLWMRLKQPNPWMLGPLSACALLSIGFNWHISLPMSLSAGGQWLIGCALGSHFDRHFFHYAPQFLLRVLLSSVLMLLSLGLIVLLLAPFTDTDSWSLLLGMTPGGIAEMSLTAESLQRAVALVTALQVLRLFLLMFLASPVYRLWDRHLSKR